MGAQAVYLASVGKALRGETDASSLEPPEGLADFAQANAHLAAQANAHLAAQAKNNTTTPNNATNSTPASQAQAPEQIAETNSKNTMPALTPPIIKGMVTDGFNVQPGHYGIDIAAPKNTPVQTVADGVVISADWTLETGFVIVVQHEHNLVSFYKHNSVLFKKVGAKVKAGEAIATIGNTGHLSSGPHLHFELWQDGKPLNPSEQIQF